MIADSASRGVEIIVMASIVGPLAILAIVIYVFFRSARRFDEAERRRKGGAG